MQFFRALAAIIVASSLTAARPLRSTHAEVDDGNSVFFEYNSFYGKVEAIERRNYPGDDDTWPEITCLFDTQNY